MCACVHVSGGTSVCVCVGEGRRLRVSVGQLQAGNRVSHQLASRSVCVSVVSRSIFVVAAAVVMLFLVVEAMVQASVSLPS